MKDLTQGSITRHILQMAAVMVIGMVGQTLYYLVDLYFVAGLGPQAIAGVGAAGNIAFVVLALTQILERRHGRAHLARRRPQGPGGRQPRVQPVAGAVGASLASFVLVGGLSAHRHRICARSAPMQGMQQMRHHVSVLVPAGPRAAVRDGVDGRGAARHRHRAAHDDGAGAHRAAERGARAGADRRLGHGASAGRRGRGPRQHDRDRRRAWCMLVVVLHAAREVRRLPQRRSGSRTSRTGSAS